ncbi:MAG: hypothetical protein JSR48_00745 [Verrucomicrobia bacterium]|nr:hypothetical protein [Verrucomicrobiota bacterium]
MTHNLAEALDNNDADPADAQRHAEALLRAYESLTTVHEFAVGDLVQWKPGMRSHRCLPYGWPVVVTAVEAGRVSNRDSDHDPADVRVILFNEDEPLQVCEFWFDSRRLMPFKRD